MTRHFQEFEDGLRQSQGSRAETGARELFLRMVQLISENRFEEVRPMLSEDVELDIHGFGPWCGSWRGADSAAATLERNFMMVTNQRPRITSLIVDGEHLAVQVEESGVFVEAETNYSIRGLMWCQFRDGKLLRFEEHVVSVAVPPEGTP